MKQTLPLVITINREMGSGGAYIGQQLSQKLNLFYADREIITKAAKQLSLAAEKLEQYEERVSAFWASFAKMYAVGIPGYIISPETRIPTDAEIFEAETKVIQHIAEKGAAVIIGRCGSHILREKYNCVSLYLHGDISIRAERIKQLYHLTEEEARKRVEQNDKDRALYYQTFTSKSWADARQYEMCLDTSQIGLDKSVDIIIKYLASIG